MATTVTVEVELDDFDLDDILDQVEARYSQKHNKAQINEWLELNFQVKTFDTPPFEIVTILDQIKVEFLLKHLDKIKLSDLENLI